MLDQTLFPPFVVGGLTFSTYEYALEQHTKNRQSDDLYIRGSSAITDAKNRLVGRCAMIVAHPLKPWSQTNAIPF